MARKNNDKITLLFRDGVHQVASNFSSSTTYLVVLQKRSLTNARKMMH
ncbi:MAG: hypothetical protein GY941_23030 [Planctomycetes bacterium]|nr:hypothetical protein [Planctomycetota bacterium]